MISADSPPTLREARLKALANLAEWQKLLTHFNLEPDEFAFIPVFVPDDDWASVCQQSLSAYLQTTSKKQLHIIPTETSGELKNLAVTIFGLEPDANFGAVWIVAPVTIKDDERDVWKSAWREGMARLNQYRNPFRQKFNIPVLLIAAAWTKEIIRDSAPDLWSVRTTVVNIEPPIVSLGDGQTNIQRIERSENIKFTGGRRNDPEFTLREAARLRGQAGKELSLAQLLHRAADSFNKQAKFRLALESSEEADNLLRDLLNSPEVRAKQEQVELEIFWAGIKFVKGVALDTLGQLNEAIIEYEKAITIFEPLVEQGRGELANNLARVYQNKGIALDTFGKGNEAIIEYEKAIAIEEAMVKQGRGEIASELAITYVNKGVALDILGQLNEAIIEYNKAITIIEPLAVLGRVELDDMLAVAYMNKGNTLQGLGQLNGAIIEYEKAIAIREALKEQGHGELDKGLALAYRNKGDALVNLGKLDEAISELQKAITIFEPLVEQGRGESANDLAGAYLSKGNALQRLGKLNEAIEVCVEAIRLLEESLQSSEVHYLPNLAIGLGNRLGLYQKAGNTDLAEKDMRRLHELLEFTKQHKGIEHLGESIQAVIDRLR